MKHLDRLVILLIFVSQLAASQLLPNLGGQRVGISSLQFLKIGVGGRGAGMGEAMTAVADDISALYWNPAGAVLDEHNALMFAHGEWLVDLKHDFLAATYHLTPADLVGLSVISLRTDDMPVTTELQPLGNGTYFSYSDLAIGLTYARKMTSQFSFGTTIRYVEEDLADLKIKAVLFDLGTYYETGLGSTRIGVSVTNFGSDVAPTGKATLLNGSTVSSFQSFSPPTVFKFGLAFEPYKSDNQHLTASVQLNHPNDNAEDVRMGLEYGWGDWLRLRAGITRPIGGQWFTTNQNSAEDYSFGLGVVAPLPFTIVSFDYAYTNFNALGAVHRISCELTY
jgi:hypothetical protein